MSVSRYLQAWVEARATNMGSRLDLPHDVDWFVWRRGRLFNTHGSLTTQADGGNDDQDAPTGIEMGGMESEQQHKTAAAPEDEEEGDSRPLQWERAVHIAKQVVNVSVMAKDVIRAQVHGPSGARGVEWKSVARMRISWRCWLLVAALEALLVACTQLRFTAPYFLFVSALLGVSGYALYGMVYCSREVDYVYKGQALNFALDLPCDTSPSDMLRALPMKCFTLLLALAYVGLLVFIGMEGENVRYQECFEQPHLCNHSILFAHFDAWIQLMFIQLLFVVITVNLELSQGMQKAFFARAKTVADFHPVCADLVQDAELLQSTIPGFRLANPVAYHTVYILAATLGVLYTTQVVADERQYRVDNPDTVGSTNVSAVTWLGCAALGFMGFQWLMIFARVGVSVWSTYEACVSRMRVLTDFLRTRISAMERQTVFRNAHHGVYDAGAAGMEAEPGERLQIRKLHGWWQVRRMYMEFVFPTVYSTANRSIAVLMLLLAFFIGIVVQSVIALKSEPSHTTIDWLRALWPYCLSALVVIVCLGAALYGAAQVYEEQRFQRELLRNYRMDMLLHETSESGPPDSNRADDTLIDKEAPGQAAMGAARHPADVGKEVSQDDVDDDSTDDEDGLTFEDSLQAMFDHMDTYDNLPRVLGIPITATLLNSAISYAVSATAVAILALLNGNVFSLSGG